MQRNQWAEDLQSSQLNSLSIMDLMNSIRRYKMVVFASIVVFVAIGLVFVKLVTKEYEAGSVILLENQQKNLKVDTVIEQEQIDPIFITSEIQVLQSRSLMEQTLQSLNLFETPEKLVFPDGKLPEGSKPVSSMSQEERQTSRDRLIDWSLRHLTVSAVDKSRAIQISYSLHNPELAAKVVNTLTQVYIEQQVTFRYDTVRRTNQLLATQVEEMQEKSRKAESEVVKYRRAQGLVDSRGIDLIEQDMSDLSKKLIDARADLSLAQSRLHEINDARSLDSAPAVLASPLIQRLREREAENMDELAQLSEELGAGHPKILASQARVAKIKDAINLEVNKIATGLRREAEGAAANVHQIEAQINKLKDQYNQYRTSNVKLQALEGEATATKEVLNALNTRWKETQSQQNNQLQTTNARVLSTAAVPLDPVRPKSNLVLAVAFIAGLGFGTVIAIALDRVQAGIYNGRQLQSVTGMTNISLLPMTALDPQNGIHMLPDYPIKLPFSLFTETVRSVSMFIRLDLDADKENKQKIYNFTSASSHEGKTTLVACLARQMAQEGLKVLAIDCDMRQPALSALFGLAEKPGVADLLTGKAKLESVLVKEKSSNLSIIGAGNVTDGNIISREIEVWHQLMEAAKNEYDVILLDSPPILYVADSRLIATGAKNILCVRWKKTPIKLVSFAMDMLARLNCPVLGTVVTMVDTRKSILIDYANNKYYTKQVKK